MSNKMGQKIVTAVIASMVIWLAYEVGRFQANWLPSLPCDSVQDEIDVYRMCIQSTSKTGCHMQVDDFRKYHQLKAQKAERCPT